MTLGKFTLNGKVNQVGKDSADAGIDQDKTALTGWTGTLTSNYPKGVPLPDGSDIDYVRVRTVTLLSDGSITEDGTNAGISLTAHDPAIFATPFQWTIKPGVVTLDNGSTLRPKAWTFNAPLDGTSVTLGGLTPVVGIPLQPAPGTVPWDYVTGKPAVIAAGSTAAAARAAIGIGGGGGDWEQFATFAAFPATGDPALEYLALDTSKLYRWNGSAYVLVAQLVSSAEITDSTATGRSVITAANAAAVATAAGLGNVDNVSEATVLSAAASAAASASKSADTIVDGTTNKVLSATDKTRLAGTSGTNTGDQTSVTGNAGTATKWAAAVNVDGQALDGSGSITVIAPGTHAATGKTTPVDADELPLVDSAASNVLKRLTWANLKAAIKTYYDAVAASPTNKDLTSGTNTFPAFTDAGAVPKSLVDAKGDLFAGTADNTVARKPVGSVGDMLVPAPSQATGLAWVRARARTVIDPAYGAVGDGDPAKAAANTTAIQTAINDARTDGGGDVYVPPSTGAYCFNGITIPTDGYVFLEGAGPGLSTGTGAVTGSVLRNVHATNPSVKAWSSVPDNGSTNRFWGLRNLGLDASAIRTGQAALDQNWAVRWDVDNVRVSYMDIGVQPRLSWGGSFRNLAIDNCTTGQAAVAEVNGTSCPVVWENLTIYNCTNGILSTNGLSGSSFFGGTIGNCVTGVNLVGTVNIGISFYGMFFENNSGDDIVIGISGTSGGTGILFSNSVFQPHIGKARSVLFGHGTEVTFDTCAWKAPFDAGTVTNGIVMQGGAGVLTLVNPRFENITNHVTRGGIVHPVPPGTGLFTVYGYGAAAGTVSRIGNGVSTVPQVATPASSATPAINVDTCDLASITALAANVTSMSSGLTGTPYNGQQLRIRFTDNGTPRTIAWGASFTGPLPTTTVASTPLNVTVVYDSVLAQWVYGGAAGAGGLAAANNLSDVASASTSRTNLGLAIGTDVQAWDADLDTWATKTSAATATASTVAARDANANLLADAFIPSSTFTATAAGTTVLTTDSTEVQFFTGATTQTVTLPTTGVVAGHRFTVVNQSTGTVTVQSSGANTVFAIPSTVSTIFIANTTTPTTAAHWTFYVQQTSYASSLAAVSTIAARNAQANLLADVFITTLASVVTSAGTTTLTVDSAGLVVYTGSTTHTVTLPTTSVTAGHVYEFINTSSGAITINSSGGNLVKTLAANATTRVTALVATPTTAAHWFAS